MGGFRIRKQEQNSPRMHPKCVCAGLIQSPCFFLESSWLRITSLLGLPCWESLFLSHCHQPSPQLSIAGTALQVHALHPGSSGLRAGIIAPLKSRNLFLIFIFYLGEKKKEEQPLGHLLPFGLQSWQHPSLLLVPATAQTGFCDAEGAGRSEYGDNN